MKIKAKFSKLYSYLFLSVGSFFAQAVSAQSDISKVWVANNGNGTYKKPPFLPNSTTPAQEPK